MGTKRKRKLKGIPKTVMKQENTLLYNENVNEKKINGRHFKRKLSVISEVPHEDDSKRCKYEVTREVFDKEKLKRLLNNVVHWRQNCEGFQDVSSKEEKREKKSDIVNKEKLKLLLNKVSEMKETELRMQKDDEINIIGVKFNGLFNPNISYNSEVMPLNSVRSNIVRHPEGGSFSQLRAERPFVTASDAGID